jgi:NhaP-type Na+/H+ and K+/H+ antiporters with a unique C-terminal domain
MLFFFASLLVIAIFSTKITSRFGVPVLLAFIGIGLVAGGDVLGLYRFESAASAKPIADALLIFILFVGGFQTKRSSLKLVAGPAMALSTVGVLLTTALLGLLIHAIARYPLAYSFMVAAIISSTDAAAVMMVTKLKPVREKVAATLEIESAANDPVAIILTLAFVKIVAGQSSDPLHLALELVWELAGGILVALVCAKASRFFFDCLESENRGYYYVLIIGVILMTYGLADLIKANGVIAVFFMGYWLGNSEFVCKRGVSNFLEGISAFSNLALFLMLGLMALPHNFAGIWREGLLISALMIFIVRPVAVLACTLPFKYTMRERLFVMWGGIKGAVPIVLASYPAAYGLDPDGNIFNIIFFAVLLSCLFQGSTMGPLAKLLRLTVPPTPHSPYSVELHSLRKSDSDMFELRVDSNSVADGTCIRDLGLPNDVLISSIVRGDKIVPPKGSTFLMAGDLVFILAPKRLVDELCRELNKQRTALTAAQSREFEIESRR